MAGKANEARRQLLEERQDVATLQLTADDHLPGSINAVYLKDRLGDVETDCRNRLHNWLLRFVGALTAPTSMALTCRWRSRPQHQVRTLTALPLSRKRTGGLSTEPPSRHPPLFSGHWDLSRRASNGHCVTAKSVNVHEEVMAAPLRPPTASTTLVVWLRACSQGWRI